MNNLSATAKLLCIALIVVLLGTLGTCALRRSRTALRVRRVDEVEQLLAE